MKFTKKEIGLREAFLATLPQKEGRASSFVIIGMLGLPGSGKSYIAKRIAQNLNIYIFSSDEIRRMLNEHGYPGESPKQELVEYISFQATRHLRKKKISYIVDADSIKVLTRVRRNARRANAEVTLVKVVCSEKEILRRLSKRKSGKGGDNDSRAGKKRYYERKQLHESMPKPRNVFYTFDSEGDIDKQVEEFSQKLKRARTH